MLIRDFQYTCQWKPAASLKNINERFSVAEFSSTFEIEGAHPTKVSSMVEQARQGQVRAGMVRYGQVRAS